MFYRLKKIALIKFIFYQSDSVVKEIVKVLLFYNKFTGL